MPLFNSAADVRKGATSVSKIYLGSNAIWSASSLDITKTYFYVSGYPTVPDGSALQGLAIPVVLNFQNLYIYWQFNESNGQPFLGVANVLYASYDGDGFGADGDTTNLGNGLWRQRFYSYFLSNPGPSGSSQTLRVTVGGVAATANTGWTFTA